jgi:hypothetical protein
MWWNTPVILTTQVAEIGGLQFKTSPDKKVNKTLKKQVECGSKYL